MTTEQISATEALRRTMESQERTEAKIDQLIEVFNELGDQIAGIADKGIAGLLGNGGIGSLFGRGNGNADG